MKIINSDFIKTKKIYLLLFLVLYQPVLFKINILHIITLFSIYVWWKEKEKIFTSITREYKVFCSCNLLYFLYSIIILMIYKNITGIYTSFLFVIELPVCVYTCFYLGTKEKINFEEAIIKCGIVQAIIAFISFLIPFVQKIIVTLYIFNGFPIETTWFLGKRFFGLSTQLTYTMPVIQSIIGILLLKRCIERKFSVKELLFSIMVLFSAIINARISFVIIGLGGVYLLYVERKQLKQVSIKYLFLLIGSISVFGGGIYIISPITFKWLFSGLIEIVTLFSGNVQATYFDSLFSEFIFFPNQIIQRIFGAGINVFNFVVNGNRSDVGYIIDLWLVGIFGMLLKYLGTLSSLGILIKKNRFSAFIIIVFLICNIKGIAFENNELMAFTNFFILMYGQKMYLKGKEI